MPDGLPINSIRALHRDEEGTLWIGTYGGGLVRLKDGKLFTFDHRHGLPDEMICSVIEDLAGNLWCSANPGLFRLQKERLEEVASGRATLAHPLLIGRREGLGGGPPMGGSSPNAIRRIDGSLCFSFADGLYEIRPDLLSAPAQPPPVRLEEMRVDGRLHPLPSDAGAGLRLPPGNGEIDLHYTAFHFAAPERLRFRYRLEGADSGWVEAGERRVASYRRLPPGHYRFAVQAASTEGDWSPAPAGLGLELLPSFWQTPWVRVVAWMLLVGATGAMVYGRIARLNHHRTQREEFTRQLIESQESERRRLANELHDGLEQELLLIKNQAQLAAKTAADPATASQVRHIADASTQAIAEVRALAANLRPYQLDRLGLTRALQSLAHNLGEASGLKITADLDPVDGIFSASGESHLYRMVQEALKNVVKHAGATHATLTLFCGAREISLGVQDDGCGFDTARTMLTHAGGFGLPNIEERVRILGGTLEIKTQPGQGTRLLMRFPQPPTA